MINAAGFKVWPAEVEALLYQHPAVQEACVIGPGRAPRRDRQGRGGAQARPMPAR
jgi:fatty-acyl-CoA synthase